MNVLTSLFDPPRQTRDQLLDAVLKECTASDLIEALPGLRAIHGRELHDQLREGLLLRIIGEAMYENFGPPAGGDWVSKRTAAQMSPVILKALREAGAV